jgi:hypothetical protein
MRSSIAALAAALLCLHAGQVVQADNPAFLVANDEACGR